MSIKIEEIENIKSQLIELQNELQVLQEISQIEPQNDRETIMQTYLAGFTLNYIKEYYIRTGYRPNGMYPETYNLLNIMCDIPPSGQITQAMIDLAKDYYNRSKGYDNNLSITIPKKEKARYLKHCTTLGHKNIAEFTRKVLKLQFAVDLANIQNDEDFDEIMKEFESE